MRTKSSVWFEVKLRYDKVHEDGYEKKGTGSFVVDALSFGEAEGTAVEFLGSYVSGEIQVVNINPMKFHEEVAAEPIYLQLVLIISLIY